MRPLWNSLAIPQKVKHSVTNDPAVPLLGLYPREKKKHVQTTICIWLFIAALFILNKK